MTKKQNKVNTIYMPKYCMELSRIYFKNGASIKVLDYIKQTSMPLPLQNAILKSSFCDVLKLVRQYRMQAFTKQKAVNITSVNSTEEEELGKIGQAKERLTGNHKQKRTEYSTPAARSPGSRTEVTNPSARTPSLRTPPVKRVEVPVARSESEVERPKKK